MPSPSLWLITHLSYISTSRCHRIAMHLIITIGMIETAWRHGKSESKITRLLPPEGEDFQYKIKVPLSRSRGWPRKVSSIAPDDLRLSIMTFDYAASAELFMPKRKLGARQAVSYRRSPPQRRQFASLSRSFPLCALSAHGCVSEMIASAAMISSASMRATAICGGVANGSQVDICTDTGFDRARP